MNNEYLARRVLCYEILIVNYSLFILGHGVIAGTTPRMATEDTFDTEPSAFEGSVLEDRFHHVLAAGRCITARGRRQRRDKDPVEIDGEEEKLSDENFPFRG